MQNMDGEGPRKASVRGHRAQEAWGEGKMRLQREGRAGMQELYAKEWE